MEKTDKKLNENEVIVKKEDLKSLIDRIDDLEKKQSGNFVLDEPEFRTCKVLVYDDLPVSYMVSGGTLTGKLKPNGEEILTCLLGLVKDDKIVEVTADYLEIIRSCPLETCRIIERKETKRVKVDGTVEVKQVKEFKTVGTGLHVPCKTTTTETEYIVDFRGKNITLKQVNIK